MLKRLVAAALLGLLPLAAASADSWVSYAAAADGFSATFPGNPVLAENAAEATRSYTVDLGAAPNDVHYFIEVDRFKPGELPASPTTGFYAAVATNSVQAMKGHIVSQRALAGSGNPAGYEFVADLPNTFNVTRYYATDNRLYTLVYTAPAGSKITPEAQRFLDSFRLTGR